MPNSTLSLLVQAIKSDDHETAQQNALWQRDINAVLANDHTILQMCSDAGAVRCFWQAILAGSSLENPHFQDHPHPLVIALKNHNNFIAKIIMILRALPDGQKLKSISIAEQVNAQIQNEGLQPRMLSLFRQVKNPSLIESLIYDVITADSQPNHLELLRRIIKFAKIMDIKHIGFENLAFLAITLKKTALFSVFLDNKFIQRKSFKFLDESFLYRAIKCEDEKLIQRLIEEDHDYQNLYPNILGRTDEIELLEKSLTTLSKAYPELIEQFQPAPILTPLTQDVYGKGIYQNANEAVQFWDVDNKNFLAFHRRIQHLTQEDVSHSFLTLMESDYHNPGVIYCLTLMYQADYLDVPEDKYNNHEYIAYRSEFGLSPLDFLIRHIQHYKDSNNLSDYLNYFQLGLNTIALRCVSLSNFKSLETLLESIRPEQQKDIIRSLLQINQPATVKLITNMLLEWGAIRKVQIGTAEQDGRLPRVFLEMVYDSLDEENQTIFRQVCHNWRNIGFLQDGNPEQIYQLYNIELNQLRDLVETLDNVKQHKWRYLPKTIMTVEAVTEARSYQLGLVFLFCFAWCIPLLRQRSPAVKNLARLSVLPVCLTALGVFIAKLVVPLSVEEEPYNNFTEYPDGVPAALALETVGSSVVTVGIFILTMMMLISLIHRLLHNDYHHSIPANRIDGVNDLAEQLSINTDGQTVAGLYDQQSGRLSSFHTDPRNLTSLTLQANIRNNVGENPYGLFFVDNEEPVFEEHHQQAVMIEVYSGEESDSDTLEEIFPSNTQSVNRSSDVENQNPPDEVTPLLNQDQSITTRCILL